MSDPKQEHPTPAPLSPSQSEGVPPQKNPTELILKAQPQDSAPHSQPNTDSRHELVSKARTFLASPQIIQQDPSAKRIFLREKGLNDEEIEGLLREHRPIVPPRSYPQLPPSNLPHLLLGIFRLFTWVTGASAFLILIYYRYLLPRITRSVQTRNALKSHHLSLLRRLTTSLSSLKESQAESFSVLPRAQPFRESTAFAVCHTVEEVLKTAGEDADIASIHPVTLLRCAITDLSADKEGPDANPSTEDLFRYLEGRIPWLVETEGVRYEEILWTTLNTCPFFTKVESLLHSGSEEATPPPPAVHWVYTKPEPVPAPPHIKSLDELLSQMPKGIQDQKSPFQHALQTLSDFTGYISAQIYLPYRPSMAGMGAASGTMPSPVEEELKREIRALKGLVLNRRAFMPTMPRPSNISSLSQRLSTT